MTEIDLRQFAALCQSNKKSERKSGVKKLSEILNDSTAIDVLDRNSSADSVNWNLLFTSAHRAIVLQSNDWKSEANKSGTLDRNLTRCENEKAEFGSLVRTVLTKANRAKPTINCDNVLDAFFTIFSDGYLIRNFGPTYTNMLKDYVLPKRMYRAKISSDNWELLFASVLDFLKREDDRIQHWEIHEAIELMRSVVEFGCEQSYLITQVKTKLLPFLEAKFATLCENAALEDALLSLTLCACASVAKESRTAVCHLGELVLSKVILFYNYDPKSEEGNSRNNTVIDFFLLQVQCHHPKGKKEGSGSAYACDWKVWNRHVRSMYRCVFGTLLKSQKIKGLKPFSDSFLDLCVELCNQLLDKSRSAYEVSLAINETCDLDQGPAAKRRKWVTCTEELFEELQLSKKENSCWPLIALACRILQKSPTLFEKADLYKLLDVLSEMQCNCNVQETMTYICKCLKELLKIMQDRKLHSDVWLNVWDTALRTAGLNQTDSHPLLQTLITAKIIPSSALESLLRMYQSHMIQLNNHSLQTLMKLMSYYHLPESSSVPQDANKFAPWALPIHSARLHLLEWLSSNSSDAHVDIEMLAHALVAVVVKVKHGVLDTEYVKFGSYARLKETPLEIDYCISAFEGGLLLPGNPESENNDDKFCNLICSSFVDSISRARLEQLMLSKRDALQQKVLDPQDVVSSTQRNKNAGHLLKLKVELVCDTIRYANLIINIISFMVKYGVITEESIIDYSLNGSLKSAMTLIQTMLLDLFKEEDNSNKLEDLDEIVKILEQFKALYASSLLPSVSNHLCHITDTDVLVVLVDLLQKLPPAPSLHIEHIIPATSIQLEDKSLPFVRHGMSLWDHDVLHFYCLDILVAFACSKQDTELRKKQKLVLQRVIKILSDKDIFPVTLESTFMMVFKSLSTILACSYLDRKNILNPIVKLLQALCKQWGKDAEASSYIMFLFKEYFKQVATDDEDDKWYHVSGLTLFAAFKHRKFGPKFSVQFIACLEELQRVDKNSKWARWSNASNVQEIVDCDSIPKDALKKFEDEQGRVAVVEESIFFLLSPFHEVRLAAVCVVASLFHGNHHSPSWMQTMFKRLHVVLYEIFIMKGADMSKEETIDEGSNRTASVLHVLSAIIASSHVCSKDALLLSFRLLKQKNLQINLVKKVFAMLAIPMKIENIHSFLERSLEFIFNQWLLWGYELQDFPFRLMGVSSFSDFISHFKGIILPIVWRNKEQPQLMNVICQEVKSSPLEIFETCFASVFGQHLTFENGDKKLYAVDAKIAKKHFDLFESIASQQKIKDLINDKIDEVLIQLSNRVWDVHHHEELLGLKTGTIQPNHPFMSRDDYRAAFKILQGALDIESDLLVTIGDQRPIVIQKVLLYLRGDISAAVTLEQRIRSLHSYSVFAHAIAFQLGKGKFSNMVDYLLSDIIHTLLYVIKENESNEVLWDVCLGACRFLSVIYEHLLPVCAPALTDLLPTVVGSIIPLARGTSELAKESLQMIKCLVMNPHLENAVGKLPPFPDTLQFDEVQNVHRRLKYEGNVFSLEEEILHFLKSTDGSTSSAYQNSMLDALMFLKKELCGKKSELSILYKNLQHIGGSSEDCKRSTLHQLICKLISLTTADTKVQLEALRCLGELGAADLTTLVLRPMEGCISIVKGYTPMKAVMALAAHFLSEYLLDHDVRVVKTASTALLSLMACKGADGLHSDRNDTAVVQSRKISPFIPRRTSGSRPTPSLIHDSGRIISILCDDGIWNPLEVMDHEKWVTKLACTFLMGLSDDDLFKDLASVCKVKTSFAEEMLPVLFFLGFHCSDDVCQSLCSCLDQFFENHCSNSKKASQTSGSSAGSTSTILMNKASVQCLLNVVHFARMQLTSERAERLELKYLNLAAAAQFCGAYLSSIMYVELWFNGIDRPSNFDGSSVALVDFIHETCPDDGKYLQSLLRKAYEQIGDNDALYGCGSAILLDPKTQVNHYEWVGKWDEVLLTYDVKLSSVNERDAANGLVNALQHSGMWYLMNRFADSLPSDQKVEMLPAQVECMWRLGQWNKPLSSSITAGCFELNRYLALQAFHDENHTSVNEYINEARLNISGALAFSSLENCKNIYKPLSQLQALQELEDFVTADNTFDTLNKWKGQNTLPSHDLLLLEPILAQRAKLIEIMISQKNRRNKGAENSHLLKELPQLYLETAKLARLENKPQIAKQWLLALSVMPQLSDNNKWQLRLEEAQVAWSSSSDVSNGKSLVARQLLGSFIKDLQLAGKKKIHTKLLPQALILYGNWMAEARSENPQQIIEDYLENALQLLEDLFAHDSVSERLEAHACLAHFADLEYQRITAYMKSESFQNKVVCMETLKNDANTAKEVKTKDKEAVADLHRGVTLSLKSSQIDEEEVKNTYMDQNKFAELAMRHYLISIKLGDGKGASLPLFRMVSLWLENSSDAAVNHQVMSSLDSIQSYKFVVLLPQLAAHIGNNKIPSFTKALQKLLMRCCADHPHHTLHYILALANSYEDCEMKVKPKPEPRVVGARQMLDELRKDNSVKPILAEMEKLSLALIALAYEDVPPSSKSAKGFNLSKTSKIRQVQSFNCAMLPTITLPVQIDGKYYGVIGIQNFESTYVIAGGINKPKKIMCLGTDGIKRPLLVKGKDDLRQDAVMQQVFTILNTLLQSCPDTERRRLRIRTYKIVPLAQRSGVLEWCQNTAPVAEVLKNVHHTYYPKDWKDSVCCKRIEDARQKTNGERLTVFKEICKNFHPSFRFFFANSFLNPAEWFARRMAYVHSVATNSMVGFILGLGDRHIYNILIDKSTAELVHIDFGIAFEQGKILPTPETVPFRLTRDFVDGMGVSGVEGVFRSSCEKTMAVLRKNQEIILTILEVLLYDPLYAWTVTPRVLATYQGNRSANSSSASIASTSESVNDSNMKTKNKMAERVLCRLKDKLQGTEDGPVSSVEGQVNRLIQQARDVGNLSRLFKGWQAFY